MSLIPGENGYENDLNDELDSIQVNFIIFVFLVMFVCCPFIIIPVIVCVI